MHVLLDENVLLILLLRASSRLAVDSEPVKARFTINGTIVKSTFNLDGSYEAKV